MYETMFRLLDTTALTFSVSIATRNYKRIMAIVHPDKNPSKHAPSVAKAVNHAYHTLLNTSKRMYYMYNGVPASNESFDETEAQRMLFHMRQLLVDHSQQVTLNRQESSTEHVHSAGATHAGSSVSDTKFEEFIKKCQQAASSASSSSSTRVSARSPPPVACPERSDSSTVSSGSRPDACDVPTRLPSDDPIGDSSAPDPEVVELVESDEDDLDMGANNMPSDTEDSGFRSSQHGGGSPQPGCRSGSSESRFSSPGSEEPSRNYVDSSTSPMSKKFSDASTSPVPRNYVDASTSPLARVFVSVSTSPLRSVFVDEPANTDGAQAGGDRGCPTVRRHLNFDDPAKSDPADGLAESSSGSSSSSVPPPVDILVEDDLGGFGGVPQRDGPGPSPREYIMSILSMRVRTKNGPAEFKVKWGPEGYESVEQEEVLLRERVGLRDWLRHLRFSCNKRYRAIMRHHRNFEAVFTAEDRRQDRMPGGPPVVD